MTGPWEKFAQDSTQPPAQPEPAPTPAPQAQGPWTKYASAAPQPAGPWDKYKPQDQEQPPEPSLLDKAKETGKRYLRGAAESLPAVGAIIGGWSGTAAGAAGGTLVLPGVGTVAGAAELGLLGTAGGTAAGVALKRMIEGALGDEQQPITEYPNEVSKAMVGQAVAGPILKGAKAMAPAAGELMTGVPAPVIKAYLDGQMGVEQLLSQAGGKVAAAAQAVQLKNLNAVKEVQASLEDPALQVIGRRATTQSDAEIGATVKQMVTGDIKQKYGPFTDAYAKMDQINQGLPLPDEGRRTLTQGIKDWALENHPESSDTYKLISKHANNIDASNTGAQLRGAMSDISGDLSDAYKTGNSKRIEALTELQTRTSEFADNQIRGLAERVAGNTATQAERTAFSRIALAGNGQDPQAIAKNYLASVDKVNQDYGGFKEYLSALQQQTGAKKSLGAGTLIKNIEAIPDEKLAQKMFTPNNAEALTRLKDEQPQVFNQLAAREIRDMVTDSISKEGSLDVSKFIARVGEMPKEIRNLTFSPEELSAFRAVEGNPKLARLNELSGQASSSLLRPGADEAALLSAGRGSDTGATRDLVELSQLTGKNLVQDAQRLAAANDIAKAPPRSLLTRSGTGAGIAATVANQAGFHGQAQALSGAVGTVAGALTSPFGLKQGLNFLNSPAAPPILSQGIVRGAQGTKNMLGDDLGGKPPP